MSDDAAIPDDVRAAWQAAEAAWDDPARHDALFERAARASCYAWAAARYKERGDDPIATARLAKLTRAAEAAMMAVRMARPPPRRRPLGFVAILVALAFAVAVALVVAVMLARKGHEGDGRIMPAGSSAR